MPCAARSPSCPDSDEEHPASVTLSGVDQPPELESHVRNLTERVQHCRRDAARVLAGGADRDVDQIRGEIRDFRQATAASFNALREDLTDLGQRLIGVEEQIGGVEEKVDTGFATLTYGMTEIKNLLNRALGDGGQSPEHR